MALFRRRASEADPVEARLAAFRAERVGAPEPPVSELLQALEAPFQRKADLWLVEVGGAWATFGWVARDATLVGFLGYDEPPGPPTDLVRANSETGLAWYDAGGDGLITRVTLPGEHVEPEGLALALAALRREAGGTEAPATEWPEPDVDAALAELPVALEEAAIAARGDTVELRIELETGCAPDEARAAWMLEMSGLRGARLGIGAAGTLSAIAALPGRRVTPGGLGWAYGEVRALAGLYRRA